MIFGEAIVLMSSKMLNFKRSFQSTTLGFVLKGWLGLRELKDPLNDKGWAYFVFSFSYL